MEYSVPSWLPLGVIEGLAASPFGALAVPALIALLAFGIMAFSIPGAMTPTAFLSGLFLGMEGLVVVLIAALLGSHILFVASRFWLGERMRKRYGSRLDYVSDHLNRRGAIYIATARFGGVPHLLLTAGAAPTTITARTFAVASLLGMLPVLTIAALAGSAAGML